MNLVFNAKNKDIFEMLKNGSKKVETRAATSKYKNIKVRDAITFSCDGDKFERKVSKVSYFQSIEELLKVYQPEDINPSLRTKEEIQNMYFSFPGYKEKIISNGIVAFEVVKS